jgi:hypothetical protein
MLENNEVPTSVDALGTAVNELAKVRQQLDLVTKSRDGYIDLYSKLITFLQASIDREEWTTEELSEIFWTELADMAGLDLKLEREITVTVTWNLTVKGKSNLDDGDFTASIESDSSELDILGGDYYYELEINED